MSPAEVQCKQADSQLHGTCGSDLHFGQDGVAERKCDGTCSATSWQLRNTMQTTVLLVYSGHSANS